MALDLLFSILADPIKQFVVAPLQRHLSYPFTYKSNLQKLEKEVEKLTVARDNLQLSVRDSTTSGLQIRPGVQGWLDKATEAITRAEDTLGAQDEAGKKMLSTGCFSVLKKRYRLSKTAGEQASALSDLQTEKMFDQISRVPTLKQMLPSFDHEEVELESRTLVFNQVVDALADPHIHVVGVYGMSGTGKTNLVSKVRSKVNEDKSFDNVCPVTVSSTPDLDKIRQRIAEILKIELKEETADGRADRLCQNLIEKKILIILDDIWGEVPLQKIGIPCAKDRKGCKILLTSRSESVLKSMRPEKCFKLESLPEEEAWSLFEKMAGGIKDEVRDVATQIAKKCGGLPLLIATVAKALKDQDSVEWKFFLKQLSKTDQMSEVNSAIELSYNYLIGDKVKSFFLLCAQLGEPEISVDHLLFYCVNLGLLQHVDTMEDGRNNVLKWIKDLKASCFLLSCGRLGFVKIHDLIRDAALSFPSRDQNVLAVTSDGITPKEWPKEKKRKLLTRICLPHCNFLELPESFGHQKAELLILGSDNGLMKIPDLFFQGGKNLKVLHLSNFFFSRLPISLASLSKLRTLCLDGCEVLDGAILGKLKNLSILSCTNSRLEELPSEIAQLTELKVLDLRGCDGLKFIPADVLSKLFLLEELYIGEFSGWKGSKMLNNQRNASLEELEGLSRLTTLEIHVPHANLIPRGLFSKNLEQFNISIGDRPWDDSNELNTLLVTLSERIHIESWFKMLIKETKTLELDFDEENGILRNILYDLDNEGFPLLKCLRIKSSTEIQHLLNTRNRVSCRAAFPILESLYMENLTSLQKICLGRLPTGSFSELTILNVEACDSLKSLFSPSVLRAISKLQKLSVQRCDNMEEIVAKENEDGDAGAVVFSNLLSLSLYNLWELRSFCSTVVVEFPQLHILTLEGLPQLSNFCSVTFQTTEEQSTEDGETYEVTISPPLFEDTVGFPVLEEIEITDIANMKKIWPTLLLPGSFGKLKSLVIQDCGNLETVFPSDMMGTFEKLEKLHIRRCDLLEEIYPFPEENPANAAFQLKELSLSFLPRLKHIWSRGLDKIITFTSLRSLCIFDCPVLKNLFPASFALNLRQLGAIEIIDCKMMEEIIQSELTEGKEIQQITFPSLKDITLERLPMLRHFYSGSAKLNFSEQWREENPRNGDAGTRQQRHLPFFPFFNHEVVPGVEELELDKTSAEIMFQCLSGEELFFTLKNVRFSGIPHKYLSEFLNRLHNLDELKLEYSLIKEVFGDYEGKNVHSTFPLIRNLKLFCLPQLNCIWKHGSKQQLESLEVASCDKLITLAPPSACLRNLTVLALDYCHGLANLVTASVATSMVQLVTMTVRNCSKLIEIVAHEGVEKVQEITFRRLRTLELEGLESLTSFCSGAHTLKFPSLEQVIVRQCPKMVIFSYNELSTPNLKRVQTHSSGWYWEGNLNETIQHMYFEMISMRYNSYLSISEHPLLLLEEKWISNKPMKFLGSITELVAYSCSSLTTAVPSNPLHFLDGLECLTVKKCDYVEQIFDLRSLNVEEILCFPALNNLTKVHLVELPSLKYALTSSVALALKALFLMEVKQCTALEEVIKKEEVVLWDRTLKFPTLNTIILHDLPALTCFYSERGVVECESLVKFDVVGCPKILDLSEEGEETVAKRDLHLLLSHFFEKQLGVQIFQEFGVEWEVLEAAFHHEYVDSEFVREIRTIKVRRYSGESGLFPPSFFQKLPGLEKIVISDAFVEDISLYEESKYEIDNFHGSLKLSKLPKLKQMIWWNKSQPTFTYFQNISELELSKCHRLKSVFPSSVAKCMHQLQSMKISKCEMLQEIVASDINIDVEDEIRFDQLSSLTLAYLPCLESFCTENWNFDFPSFQQVTIFECPNMKFFSQGVINTPKLDEFEFEGCSCLEDSLDKTIREFAEMNAPRY